MMIDQDDWFYVYDIFEVVYSVLQRSLWCGQQKGDYCFLGCVGLLCEYLFGQFSMDVMLDIDNVYLMDFCEVDGEFYVCGIQNQVLWQNKGVWQCIDQGFYVFLGDEVIVCLNGIDGFLCDDVYVVGDVGVIWYWDGKGWQVLVVFINLLFYCVYCVVDGIVYIGGFGGILLCGSVQVGWIDIGDCDLCLEVLENMVEFVGKFYVIVIDQLFEYDGMCLSEIKVLVQGKKVYYVIDVKFEVMWVVGDECVFSYDGGIWQCYVCLEN